MIKEFADDITKYSAEAKKYLGSKDKKCDALAIWPEEVLVYCNTQAEANGFGDDELNFCTCYDDDKKMLTKRKPKTKGADAKNFEKINFAKGAPEEIKPDLTV